MTESPVDNIRASSRNTQSRMRELHRQEELDLRRDFPSLQISREEVLEVANKLKTKSSITAVELKILKFGLMDDRRNIKEFLSVQGALRGLVRELSGNDVAKQCVAASCCGNLAFTGDEKTSLVVAKAAGHYLVVALSNLCTELSSISAWALGGLAAAGRDAAALLQAQGAAAGLARLLAAPAPGPRDSVLYALAHLANQLGDELRPELLRPLWDATLAGGFSLQTTRFLFILSCHDEFVIADGAHTAALLARLRLRALPAHLALCRPRAGACCEAPYLFRTLANNVVSDGYYAAVLDFFMDARATVAELIRSGGGLRTLLYWLLGNLHAHAAPEAHPFFATLPEGCLADVVATHDRVDFDPSAPEDV